MSKLALLMIGHHSSHLIVFTGSSPNSDCREALLAGPRVGDWLESVLAAVWQSLTFAAATAGSRCTSRGAAAMAIRGGRVLRENHGNLKGKSSFRQSPTRRSGASSQC